VPNISEVPSGVLIIEFVRWLCGPWVAFGHWRTDLIFEWYLVRCGFKNISQEDICLKKVTCSKYIYNNYSKFSSQHNWGGDLNINDHLMSMRIFTFHGECDIHMNSKTMRIVATAPI
jgi:hypothetical protein